MQEGFSYKEHFSTHFFILLKLLQRRSKTREHQHHTVVTCWLEHQSISPPTSLVRVSSCYHSIDEYYKSSFCTRKHGEKEKIRKNSTFWPFWEKLGIPDGLGQRKWCNQDSGEGLGVLSTPALCHLTSLCIALLGCRGKQVCAMKRSCSPSAR